MKIEAIKAEVCKLAPNSKCIWPNGWGFTYRGWEYVYCPVDNARWVCRGRKVAGSQSRVMYHVGRGESPTDAKANAYPHGEGAYSGWFEQGKWPAAFCEVPLPMQTRIVADNYEHGGERVAIVATSGRGRNRAIKVRTEAGVEFWTNPGNLRK